jgi:polyphosphate kinase
LRNVVLDAYLRDNVKARKLTAAGTYERIEILPGQEEFDVQKYFVDATRTNS